MSGRHFILIEPTKARLFLFINILCFIEGREVTKLVLKGLVPLMFTISVAKIDNAVGI